MAARGKSAGKLLGEVRQRAAEGWPAGLVVLHGDSTFHLDAAQKAILDAVVPAEAGEYALTVYGDDKVSVGTVVASCRSMGMFSERRVVLVRDVMALDGEKHDALLDYAKNPASDSHLIIRATTLDRRRKFHKALATKGQFLSFELPSDPMDSAREIQAIAKSEGLTLDREATMLLADVCGGDLYRVSTELAKLSAWLGGKGKAGVPDLRETLAGEGALSGWELANAIFDRDRSRALEAARLLVDSGDEPLRVIGGLAWRARKALGSRDRSRYSQEELLAFPSHLLTADRALKSRQIGPHAVLESLVDRLVGEA
jgi:DNA polymerase-3 subunit delta